MKLVGKILDWFDCWRGEHHWFTVVGPGGMLLRAEPCDRCGVIHPRSWETRFARPADPVGEDPECE